MAEFKIRQMAKLGISLFTSKKYYLKITFKVEYKQDGDLKWEEKYFLEFILTILKILIYFLTCF